MGSMENRRVPAAWEIGGRRLLPGLACADPLSLQAWADHRRALPSMQWDRTVTVAPNQTTTLLSTCPAQPPTTMEADRFGYTGTEHLNTVKLWRKSLPTMSTAVKGEKLPSENLHPKLPLWEPHSHIQPRRAIGTALTHTRGSPWAQCRHLRPRSREEWAHHHMTANPSRVPGNRRKPENTSLPKQHSNSIPTMDKIRNHRNVRNRIQNLHCNKTQWDARENRIPGDKKILPWTEGGIPSRDRHPKKESSRPSGDEEYEAGNQNSLGSINSRLDCAEDGAPLTLKTKLWFTLSNWKCWKNNH